MPPVARVLRAISSAIAVSWLTLACESGYVGEPTACDDYCRATQRASCAEDYPEKCVSGCEDTSAPGQYPDCEAEWQALVDCYAKSPAALFHCDQDVSRPSPGLCLEQQIEFGTCAYPVLQSCILYCGEYSDRCGEPEETCWGDCAELDESCSDVIGYYGCMFEHADDCDLRSPSCDDSRGAFRVCLGIE